MSIIGANVNPEQEGNMNLSTQITQTRNRMIKVGMEKGLSNQWTIALSQQLDGYLVDEQKRRMKA